MPGLCPYPSFLERSLRARARRSCPRVEMTSSKALGMKRRQSSPLLESSLSVCLNFIFLGRKCFSAALTIAQISACLGSWGEKCPWLRSAACRRGLALQRLHTSKPPIQQHRTTASRLSLGGTDVSTRQGRDKKCVRNSLS